ncbi:MAG TPA: GvpL/GvpF family gas vesicle protein [Micromonosporaceae bacterium]
MPFLHVYAIVRAGHAAPEHLVGVGDPPGEVRLVASGPIAAVVSEVADDFEPEDEDAVRHFDVLTALVRTGPVLPVRFGTVAPEDAAIRDELLDPVVDDAVASLDELDGLVEVRLTVDVDEDRELRDVVATWPELREEARYADGADLAYRIELGERVNDALAERAEVRDDRIAEALRPLVVAEVRLPTDAPTTSRHAFLVRADELRILDAAVAALRKDLGDGYRMEYVGPLPAVDFIAADDLRGRRDASRWGW